MCKYLRSMHRLSFLLAWEEFRPEPNKEVSDLEPQVFNLFDGMILVCRIQAN